MMTYLDRPTMDGEGAVTAEEAILSSLGQGAGRLGVPADEEKVAATESLPSRVEIPGSGNLEDRKDDESHGSSIVTELTGNIVGVEDPEGMADAEGLLEVADEAFRETCNVEFLREGIVRRSVATVKTRGAERGSTAANEDMDIEDLHSQLPLKDFDGDVVRDASHNLSPSGIEGKALKGFHSKDREPHQEAPNGTFHHGDGASPAAEQFYRALDEITSKQRESKLTKLLQSVLDHDGAAANFEEIGAMWYPRAAAAAGAGNERGQDTLISAILAGVESASTSGTGRAKIGLGGAQNVSDTPVQSKKSLHLHWYKVSVGLAVLLFMASCGVFFGFGCYGFYVFFFSTTSAQQGTPVLNPPDAPPKEIVVRIVREIIHVSSDGSTIQPLNHHMLYNDVEDVESSIVSLAQDGVADCLGDSTCDILDSIETKMQNIGSPGI
eukprot:CAMPEP_0183322188 /NCGR_PEP_ID=MMETSP0160_2-20130417/70947_1 /TAXON_ID=2839 ORGANISM="Odontella Sinensis, Strain Grunow 1884" /NCGR_SAMPLE_ID=MMETSP0160_2 /ASSEMBLY_ACC=CAM_ASM_000250 /LENGTH=438 /DNA_ID=CAMNT_0025489289 /DNA_START=29 /DNA_END=1345 /DNA_ORIENTATION=-